MPENPSNPKRAVILTAIPVEYQAVRVHLTDIHREKHETGTFYERGTFVGIYQVWDIGIAQVGAGNVSAATQTERAINHFKPDTILFVGVAGSLKDKDAMIGDVVVATKVYGYESGKDNITFQPRPQVENTAHRMVELARMEILSNNWLKRLPEPLPVPHPRVWLAPIAAGERVVASKRSEAWKRLSKMFSDAIAVEMEGHGFLSAVHANPGIDALVIRGISDLIENKSISDASGSQEMASRHASAFAFELLANLDSTVFRPDEENGIVPEQDREGYGEHPLPSLPQGVNQNPVLQPPTNCLQQHYEKMRKKQSLFSRVRGEQRKIAKDLLESTKSTVNSECGSKIKYDRSLMMDVQNINQRVDTMIKQLNDSPGIEKDLRQEFDALMNLLDRLIERK